MWRRHYFSSALTKNYSQNRHIMSKIGWLKVILLPRVHCLIKWEWSYGLGIVPMTVLIVQSLLFKFADENLKPICSVKNLCYSLGTATLDVAEVKCHINLHYPYQAFVKERKTISIYKWYLLIYILPTIKYRHHRIIIIIVVFFSLFNVSIHRRCRHSRSNRSSKLTNGSTTNPAESKCIFSNIRSYASRGI